MIVSVKITNTDGEQKSIASHNLDLCATCKWVVKFTCR